MYLALCSNCFTKCMLSFFLGDQDTPSPENVNQWESKKSWSISDYGVHPCILDKLRLHNFIQDMEKVRSLFQLAWNFLITRHWSKKENAWISRTLLDKWKIGFWLSVNFIAYLCVHIEFIVIIFNTAYVTFLIVLLWIDNKVLMKMIIFAC